MNQFHVGQRVVCIDDKFKNVSIDQGIREGQIYTLRWVGMYSHYVDGDFLGVRLMEVDRGNDDGPEGYGAADMPFAARRFRPLVSDPLIVFRQIATDPDFKIDAPEGPRRERVKEPEEVSG